MSFKCFFLNTAAVDFASQQLQTAVGRIVLSHVVSRAKIPSALSGHCDWGCSRDTEGAVLMKQVCRHPRVSLRNDAHVWPQLSGVVQAFNLLCEQMVEREM